MGTADGYHGDCSQMYTVGAVDDQADHLIATTRGALEAAIGRCAPDVPLSAIGETIAKYVGANSAFRVVDEFTGHGIGTEFHMMPYIIHTPNDFSGTMKAGHTFTIEPVLVE